MVNRNKWEVFLVISILVLAFFLRTYRIDELLGFYYDQGRDALAVWNLWHKADFFLIGPTTGIEGIFLGPFYYYYIAIPYILGQGNPAWPSIWLSLTNVLAIGIIYKIVREYFDKATAFLVIIFCSFSNYLIQSQRWLSNPTPLPLFATLILWSLLKIIKDNSKVRWWILLGLSVGLSLQLEAASAVFFLPVLITIFIWQKIKVNFVGFLSFFTTLIPQILFDLRNNHLLFKSFYRFLVSEKSFQLNLVTMLKDRLNFYWQTFSKPFVPDMFVAEFVVLALFLLVLLNRSLFRNVLFKILLLWWLIPVLLLLFYHGNNGYIWGYYFTGVFLFNFVLTSIVLRNSWKRNSLKPIVTLLILIFIVSNMKANITFLNDDTTDDTHVTLSSSLAIVDWVYKDSGKNSFNVDVYVPPVIPYSYDYLFLWRGQKYATLPNVEKQNTLYTVYEVDPPHPERLQAWFNRQDKIGKIEKEFRFGGVGVQRRTRYE